MASDDGARVFPQCVLEAGTQDHILQFRILWHQDVERATSAMHEHSAMINLEIQILNLKRHSCLHYNVYWSSCSSSSRKSNQSRSLRSGSDFLLHLVHVVNDAVLLRFVSGEEEVAVDVALNLLKRLARLLRENLIESIAKREDALGAYLNV